MNTAFLCLSNSRLESVVVLANKCCKIPRGTRTQHSKQFDGVVNEDCSISAGEYAGRQGAHMCIYVDSWVCVCVYIHQTAMHVLACHTAIKELLFVIFWVCACVQR